MNRFKYIFIISLIALFASCAKDDEISLGSLKIDSQVTNITTTSVVLKFTQPTNAVPLNVSGILLYDGDGNPVTGYSNDYGRFPYDNTISATEGESCVVKALKPNTTYKYELIVYETNKQSVNNGSDDHYWGAILLSDPSYTFTTL